MATRACVSTRRASGTTRSRWSRCRSTIRRARASSASRASRRTSTDDGWNGCHDISVYMAINRAASACMGEGRIWDISDKAHPRTIARVHNANVEFFHSATSRGTARPWSTATRPAAARSRAAVSSDSSTLGALWFYDVASLDVMDGARRGAAEPLEGPAHPGRRCELHDAQLQHAPDHEAQRARVLGLRRRDDGRRLHGPDEAGRGRPPRPARSEHLVGVLVQRPHLHQRRRPRRRCDAAVGQRARGRPRSCRTPIRRRRTTCCDAFERRLSRN